MCIFVKNYKKMTLQKIAEFLLKEQKHEINDKHLGDAYHKYRLALNNPEKIEAITLMELEIAKIKDALDLSGFKKSDQFEIRFYYLKRLCKELMIL